MGAKHFQALTDDDGQFAKCPSSHALALRFRVAVGKIRARAAREMRDHFAGMTDAKDATVLRLFVAEKRGLTDDDGQTDD